MNLLTLTYPLTPVTQDACGGTEQVALQLLSSCARCRDWNITWVGAAGSQPVGGVRFTAWEDLLAGYQLPRLQPGADYPPAQLQEMQLHCEQAAAALARELAPSLHLIHNQGAFFARTWPADVPVLFTLHLARSLYPADLLSAAGPHHHFQCVSRSQQESYGASACCGYIANGIDLAQFPVRSLPAEGSAPLLYLGRICPEKAPHEAIAIARMAHRRLWIVGAVAPFPSHQHYFATRIAPELGRDIQWFSPPTLAGKRQLLAEAAALVVPSAIEETSSIAAMEAAASGVPVLATRRGALPEIVADGETGWLGSPPDLAAAVSRLEAIDPAACRRRVERLFAGERMVSAYLALFRRLARP